MTHMPPRIWADDITTHRSDGQWVDEPRDGSTEYVRNDRDPHDCTFLYFKPSGKWGYEGRGQFGCNNDGSVDRERIKRNNANGMPGISGDGVDYTIVIIPDETCDHPFAYPRILKHGVLS